MRGFGYERAKVGPEIRRFESYALQMCKYGLREPFPQHGSGKAFSNSDSDSTSVAHTDHQNAEAQGLVYFRTLLAV
jgi:hypothetical protein